VQNEDKGVTCGCWAAFSSRPKGPSANSSDCDGSTSTESPDRVPKPAMNLSSIEKALDPESSGPIFAPYQNPAYSVDLVSYELSDSAMKLTRISETETHCTSSGSSFTTTDRCVRS
jgi:hypothetical protein